MRVDHRAQQLPGAASAVHADHAQDLQEAHAPQRGCGEDVALRARSDDSHRGHEHDEVCRGRRGGGYSPAREPSHPGVRLPSWGGGLWGGVGGVGDDREGPWNLPAVRVWVRLSTLGFGVRGQARGGGGAGLVTDDTEGFSGKAEAALPSSVAAAASRGPDADDVLQAKHHDHHEFLWDQGPEFRSPLPRSKGPGPTVLAQPRALG